MTPQHPESELPFMERLVIPVHLSGTGNRQILLQLDSGSDGRSSTRVSKRNSGLIEASHPAGKGVSKAQRTFAVLPPQDMQIGARTLSHVYFVTPVNVEQNAPKTETTACCQPCSSSVSLSAKAIIMWFSIPS